MRNSALFLLLLFWFPLAALAQISTPEPNLDQLPPTQREQARQLGQELRCVVCQGQSVADSRAPLAGDMRALIVERLKAGDSPETIRAFFAARYGAQILLRPPVGEATYALWFAPALFLLLGLFFALRALRKRPA